VNGEHILCNLRRNPRQRVDILLRIYSWICFAILLVSTSVSLWLALLRLYPVAATFSVLAVAVVGHGYTTVLQRQMQIKDITDKTVEALRTRWDELRKDSDLIRCFSGHHSTIDQTTGLKLRLYLATLLDVYAVIVHYIHCGYFSHAEEFAVIYEGMIKSLFKHPYVIDAWRGGPVWGEGRLQDEYGKSLTHVINGVISEVLAERSSEKVSAQHT
jgi:hypothetical protein